jgi:hypothetical protein
VGEDKRREEKGANEEASKTNMVQVEMWDEFTAKAEELCRGSPLDTRYTVKYNHKDGKMVLKITNNVVCFTYKTTQASDLKKMEKLNRTMSAIMTRGADVDVEALETQ